MALEDKGKGGVTPVLSIYRLDLARTYQKILENMGYFWWKQTSPSKILVIITPFLYKE